MSDVILRPTRETKTCVVYTRGSKDEGNLETLYLKRESIEALGLKTGQSVKITAVPRE